MSLARRLAAAAGATAAAFLGRKAARKLLPLVEVAITPVALGAAVSAGAVALFFNIADDIRGQDGVWRFDHDGLNLAESLRTPERTALMRTVSDLARPDIMSALGAASMIIAWRSKKWRNEAVLMAVVLSGGGAIIGTIKYRVGRQRPNLVEALAVEETFSFPSGHSFIALCFYGTLAYWWMKGKPLKQRLWIATLATKFIALIGASRVYLGVHYPSDVLAGYAAAVPWLTACLTAYEKYERQVALLESRD
ncbi:phosphatase PAP2 family protein [Armatimonas rosea]|uniref:Undecaprenyl-diphosphatase n=1 Tax=Armatimonas rosea TaxID=685828 RepID=A0A7W9W7X5_ARMRO|nr:phosphatase PAP2 family protein [Armatimonas rosea]MBB6052143.1 undecaprenyl-diphosphatase [Armatimonas rosea]